MILCEPYNCAAWVEYKRLDYKFVNCLSNRSLKKRVFHQICALCRLTFCSCFTCLKGIRFLTRSIFLCSQLLSTLRTDLCTALQWVGLFSYRRSLSLTFLGQLLRLVGECCANFNEHKPLQKYSVHVRGVNHTLLQEITT